MHNFTKIARSLIAVHDAVELARRYLSIRRRRRIVMKAKGSERYVNRLELQRRYLEQKLLEACRSHGARFCAVVDKQTVLERMSELPVHGFPSLVIAFSPSAGLLINGKAVQTAWGEGCGLAVVCRLDLRQALYQAQYGICIQAFDDHWVAWIDSTPSGAPSGFKQNSVRFDYFCLKA